MAAPRQSIGRYQVTTKLGAGGMGEVWRATGPRLQRDVAIKVLPPAFASDPMRMARFTREAQVLASLNHPGIASIYGVEQNALVMELVEGPTLGERIARGKIPLEKALALATQMAEALEYAHERGIVHRDLKPANVKITPEGRVKILDFGLAKAVSVDESSTAADAETLSSPATLVGTILGTASYMSPEQARGEPVDRRADIWALGVVLYEMLTGRRPFDGATVSDTLAAVLRAEPDWQRVPEGARPTLRRCLEKEPRRRLRDAADAMLLLADAVNPAAAGRSAAPHWRLAALGAGVLLLAAASALLMLARSGGSSRGPVLRAAFVLPEGQTLAAGRRAVAIAPDGSKIVYVANRQLYLRVLDQLDAQPIPGTSENPSNPVISPDGREVAYSVAGGVLRKVSLAGGAPVTLCQLKSPTYGMSWRGSTIAFGENSAERDAIMTVSDTGGTPRVLAAVDSREGYASRPQLLEDGKPLVFAIAPQGSDAGKIVIQGLDGTHRQVLVTDGFDPMVLPAGVLLYMHAGTLFGVDFDPKRLRVSGGPVALVAGMDEMVAAMAGQYAVARNGVLVYAPGSYAQEPMGMEYVNPQGGTQPVAAPPRAYEYPRVSPDGSKAVLNVLDGSRDIWVWDFGHHTLSRLTAGDSASYGGSGYEYGTWMPDGRQILYGLNGTPRGAIFRMAADGTGVAVEFVKPGAGGVPQAVSSDGKWLVSRANAFPGGIFASPLHWTGPSVQLVDPKFNLGNAALSPDSRWIAYQSDESGSSEVYVRPFPAVGTGRWQVSTGGGSRPVWARNGGELFYWGAGQSASLMSVSIRPSSAPGASFSFDNPKPLFPLAGFAEGFFGTNYDVTPDGRFLMLIPAGGASVAASNTLVVVSNWFDEVRARMH